MIHVHVNVGNVDVSLWRYLVDARSIPVIGEEDKGMEPVPSMASFSVRDGGVSIEVGGANSIKLGTHLQYRVNNKWLNLINIR